MLPKFGVFNHHPPNLGGVGLQGRLEESQVYEWPDLLQRCRTPEPRKVLQRVLGEVPARGGVLGKVLGRVLGKVLGRVLGKVLGRVLGPCFW